MLSPKPLKLTIKSGKAVSEIVPLNGRTPVAVIIPANCTGTELYFETSYNGVRFSCYEVDGSTLVKAVIGGASVIMMNLNPDKFRGFQSLGIKSNSNEGADREFVIMCADLS